MVKYNNVREAKFWLWLTRCLPHRLRYWCVIDAGGYATTGQYSKTLVPEVTFMEVLKRIEGWS